MTDLPDRLAEALKDRYAIQRELGRGGMATVYLAEDLKHHRKVALKVLRLELASTLGPDRFLREITVAANLSHPHILPLYDSGEAGGFLFYVMPFVDGPSLRQKLIREGELPIPDAVRILRDVADALSYAHQQGVVHRDIKPENVMLSGRHALVADFGVARAIDESAGGKLTETGVALGTPVYMAPEQAAADPHTDHRADVYAFGVTAYEMLTGQPPFAGATPQAVLAAHWTEAPVAVAERRATIPPALAQLVMRCLEKKPADRPQGADELVQVLEGVATPSGGITPTQTQPVPARFRPSTRTLAVVGGTAAVIAIGGLARLALRGDAISIATSDIRPVTSEPGVEFQPAISPDGKEVAFIAGRLGNQRLVVRSAVNVTGGGEFRLADTAFGIPWLPRWSPNGEFVRFLACTDAWGPWGDCAWKEIGRLGGSVRSVTVPRNPEAAAWSPDGTRIAFSIDDSVFIASEADGSTALVAAHPNHPVGGLHSLAWSPDGRRLAYVGGNVQWLWSGNILGSSIWIVDAAGGEPLPVTSDDFLNVSPAWLDDDHLLFVSNRDGPRGVYVVRVGAQGTRGEARSVPGASDVHSIAYSPAGRALAFARLSLRQNIWAFPTRAVGPVSVAEGHRVTDGNQVIEEHDVSPDGRWIVYDSNLGGNANIYKVSLDGGAPVQLSSEPGDEMGPRWSPDGTEIAFYAGPGAILVIPAGGGTAARLTGGRGSGVAPAWSPDGLQIAFLPSGLGPRAPRFMAREHVGGPWGEPVELGDLKCGLGGWVPDGSGILCGGRALTIVSPTGQVVGRRDLQATYRLRGQGYPGKFSPDAATFYLFATHEDGRRGIWAIPWRGGTPRLVVSDDDPARALIGAVSVGPDQLYVTVSEYESDIWVMHLRY